MDAALKAIAQPHRRQVLRLLRGTELAAGEIASRFALTGPAVSQHLRVLHEAGLIAVRRDGTRRLYRLRQEGLDELRAALEELWDDRLAALKEQAEHDQRSLHG